MSLPTDPDCYWVESGLLEPGYSPASIRPWVAGAGEAMTYGG